MCVCVWGSVYGASKHGTICTSSTQIWGEFSLYQALRGAGWKSHSHPGVVENVPSLVTAAQVLLPSITWLSALLRATDAPHTEHTSHNLHNTQV